MSSNRFYGAFDTEHLPGSRPERDHRTPFQVDRDRVVFSTAFRQLQSKTQVFQSGEYDFYRTRLTHTIEVARIARSIAEYLNASSDRLRPDFALDPDLVEAVALAHDLGHPPFGHIGERKLNALLAPWGGFEGNAQTLRILTCLIYPRPDRPEGMRPTRAFLDGVLKYKRLLSECAAAAGAGGRRPGHHFIYDDQADIRAFVFGDAWPPPGDPDLCKSIECQIMDWADDTAYSLHDIVDGVKARFITADALAEWGERQSDLSAVQAQVLEELIDAIRGGAYEPRAGRRVGQFIRACRIEPCDSPLARQSNRHRFRLEVDPRIRETCGLHQRIAVDLIFRSALLQQIEFKGGQVLGRLFEAYAAHHLQPAPGALRILPEATARWIDRAPSEAARARLICDHMAGMTDGQAIRAYRRLYEPDFGSLLDLP
jgi:dGTPase